MAKKQEKPKQAKRNITHHVKKHLNKKVEFSVGLILLIVIIVAGFLIKFPYEETEEQTKIREVVTTRPVEDCDNMVMEEVCEEVEPAARIEVQPFSPYMRPYGLEDHICKAEVRIYNEGKNPAKWTLQYVFIINGVDVPSEQITMEVPTLNPQTFEFETLDCSEGDSLDGRVEVVDSPTVEECKTKQTCSTKMEEVTEQVTETETIIVTKHENLWQKIF